MSALGKAPVMSDAKKTTVTRDYRVTVTVEEIEAPKMNDAPKLERILEKRSRRVLGRI
jgi:hypothetical protein